MTSYRLLSEFRALFEGRLYRHRASTQGDRIATCLYEDLAGLARSRLFTERVTRREHVINVANKRQGIKARRGDGTFGELIPHIEPIIVPGYTVARGPIATVEIGVEVKILMKAMIQQIGRVQTDMRDQVGHFNRGAGTPICVGIAAINHAEYCTTYEGDRAWRTDGKDYAHPCQEAKEAEKRLLDEVAPKYNEFLLLRYRATNEPPYPFEWVDYIETFKDYGAILTRISRKYDVTFGPNGTATQR